MDSRSFVLAHVSKRKRAVADIAVIFILILFLFAFVGLPHPPIPGVVLLFLTFRLGMAAQRMLTASNAEKVRETSTADSTSTLLDPSK